MIRRGPPLRREACTTSVMPAADVVPDDADREIDARSSRPSSPSGVRASRALLAWIVVIEPSWPVFMACSMSQTSGPRTSPTMMRSGRMRRLFRTRSRCVTSPAPSVFGGPRFHADAVAVLQDQFGRVFDRDDPLAVGHEQLRRR